VVGELFGYGLARDEDAVVDRADELVHGDIDIGIGGKLATLDGAQQWKAVAVALLAEVVGA
jgi:hypothetical protein